MDDIAGIRSTVTRQAVGDLFADICTTYKGGHDLSLVLTPISVIRCKVTEINEKVNFILQKVI